MFLGSIARPYQLPDGVHLRERADRGSKEVVAIDPKKRQLAGSFGQSTGAAEHLPTKEILKGGAENQPPSRRWR